MGYDTSNNVFSLDDRNIESFSLELREAVGFLARASVDNGVSLRIDLALTFAESFVQANDFVHRQLLFDEWNTWVLFGRANLICASAVDYKAPRTRVDGAPDSWHIDAFGSLKQATFSVLREIEDWFGEGQDEWYKEWLDGLLGAVDEESLGELRNQYVRWQPPGWTDGNYWVCALQHLKREWLIVEQWSAAESPDRPFQPALAIVSPAKTEVRPAEAPKESAKGRPGRKMADTTKAAYACFDDGIFDPTVVDERSGCGTWAVAKLKYRWNQLGGKGAWKSSRK